MASGKLDLPDDILSSKSSDQSSNPGEALGGGFEEKGPAGVHDDLKDLASSENSIPLSPQWLYNKPSESRMDLRAPTSMSLGNSIDPVQKDGWRLDGSEDRKDWRRMATGTDSSRRWREEERETGLLGARRDRRKTDRRVDSVPIRETTESRALPSSDRWHDNANRNTGHDSRRDSKWSSRWGPEDKEKEPRTEKRTDVEKEKEDVNRDHQSTIVGNRSASERDSDSRDKWRPRHRMDVHSAGSTPYRAAPGFGTERGRVEGSHMGFSIGRGRSNGVGRSASAATARSYASGNIIGKPKLTTDSFCYPRGKLLDIYRQQKLDSSFGAWIEEIDESPPITEVNFVEPMAFVTPDSEEDAILIDIWKGKITSSGVVYNSFRKGRAMENASDVSDSEMVEGNHGVIPSAITGENADTCHKAENDKSCQTGHAHVDVINGENEGIVDELNVKGLKYDGTYSVQDIDSASYAAAHLSCTVNHSSPDEKESASWDVKSKLPDDSSSLFVIPSSEHNESSTPQLEINDEKSDQEKIFLPEDLYFYYIDPQGNTQGPFLGADIILWFEEGYFGIELPVRLADAPEGTAFQSLGEVIPQLKFRNPNSEQEKSSASGGNLEPCLPPASVLEVTGSATVNDLCQPLAEFNNLSSQNSQSRMSEPDAPMQLPRSEGQNFQDFFPQDEEIVFPGRPHSSDYSAKRSSANVSDWLSNSSNHSTLPNELTERTLQYQNNHKFHPFGLLWSELEGSHDRHTELSDMSSNAGRATPVGAMNDTAYGKEKLSDFYRQDALSGPNSFNDAIAGRHLSNIDQEPKHLDIADQFMSLKFHQQEQLQQRNLLAQHARMSETRVDHMPNQNFNHQQKLANHPSPDLENILALQLQRQQQQQLQQQQLKQHLQQQHQLQQQQQLKQQLQQQQKQQFHQQQKLLHERQQSQARQLLLEQLLHGQIPDPGLLNLRVDSMRPNNVRDQVLLEPRLLPEMQQRAYHPPSHFIPSVEQLNQAKFGLGPEQEQQRALFDLLHGQIPLEHEIRHPEHMQARQLSTGLRQRLTMDEERHMNSVWPVSDNDQLHRQFTGSRGVNSSGINPLDIYQQHQRSPHEEQLSHLERSLSFHDRLHQGLYEPSSLPVSVPQEDQLSHLEHNLSFQDRLRQGLYDAGSAPFERSLSLPAGAPRPDMDVINAIVRARDMQELSSHMQSGGQPEAFLTGVHAQNSRQPVVPNQFHVSHMDSVEDGQPELKGPPANDWIESRIQQLQINAERQRREVEAKLFAESPRLWMSDGHDDDKSRRLLMELLHQKSGHQPAESSHVNNGVSSDRKAPSGLYPGSSSSNHPFTVFSNQEAGLNNSFVAGSYGSSASLTEINYANEQVASLENNDKFPFGSESNARVEGHSILSGISQTAQTALSGSKIVDKSSMNKDYIDVEERKLGSKNRSMSKVSLAEVQGGLVEQSRLVARDRGEISVSALSRQSSIGVTEFYDDKSGSQSSFAEDISRNPVSLPSKGPENTMLRRPPASRALPSSQEGLSDLVSDTIIQGKGSLSGSDVLNSASQGTDITVSSQKDVRFRRSSSYSDADVAEPSFSDMLKSNARKAGPQTVDHQMVGAGADMIEGMQGGKGGKKKTKKGRQIDPALLGFKVTSNRIMMGEIQRIDD